MKKLLCIFIALSVTLSLSATAFAKKESDVKLTYQDDGTTIVGVQDGNTLSGWCAVYLTGEYEGCAFWGYFEDNKASGNLCLTDGSFIPATYEHGVLVPVHEGTEETETAQKDDKEVVTMGMKNALKSAEQYLDVMPFSYTGLIEQLEFSQYTHEEAVYAADHCGADWNEQAVKSAEQYLSLMSFSRNGLIEQLEYAGFTNEQAVHAVTQCGY